MSSRHPLSRHFTVEEFDEYFASPFTAPHLKQLWAACLFFEMGEGFREIYLSGHPRPANKYPQMYQSLSSGPRPESSIISEIHGVQQLVTDLESLHIVRVGNFLGYRVAGEFFAHESEPYILAFYFGVLRSSAITHKRISFEELNEYFLSPLTENALRELWLASRNPETNEENIKVDLATSLVPRWSSREEHFYKLRVVEARDRFFGLEPYLDRMATNEEVRLGSVRGEYFTGIFAVHPTERFIVAFFFWLRKP